MNREIKFRAWHPNHGMTITPILKRNDFNGEVYCMGYDNNGMLIQLPLMQFTGLYDKEGIEIYEGDIVSYKEESYHSGRLIPTKSVVEYGGAGFEPLYADGIAKHEFEIIGNIYENPEILDNVI